MPIISISAFATAPLEISRPLKTPRSHAGEEEEVVSQECRELLRSLPKEKGWRTRHLHYFQGFWCQAEEIQAITSFQNHFQAMTGDVFLSTIPKSGTTWLKALAFALINRGWFPPSSTSHPLTTSNPHDLVPFMEYKVYADHLVVPDLDSLPPPRLFATHVPFSALPDTITNSNTNTKIIYLCRNPLDTFVSSWHYISKIKSESRAPLPLEEAFEMYCKGIVGFGPFWDHMLGYWNQSLEQPDRVLFMKYEDMQEDIVSNLKLMAGFLGVPFTQEEEEDGLVEEVARLCSFEQLKDLEANKSGKSIKDFENKHLFRKAQVGDWVNNLSPAMAQQLTKVMDQKFSGSGLEFKLI